MLVLGVPIGPMTVNVAVPQRSPFDLIHQVVVDVRMLGQYLLIVGICLLPMYISICFGVGDELSTHFEGD